MIVLFNTFSPLNHLVKFFFSILGDPPPYVDRATWTYGSSWNLYFDTSSLTQHRIGNPSRSESIVPSTIDPSPHHSTECKTKSTHHGIIVDYKAVNVISAKLRLYKTGVDPIKKVLEET